MRVGHWETCDGDWVPGIDPTTPPEGYYDDLADVSEDERLRMLRAGLQPAAWECHWPVYDEDGSQALADDIRAAVKELEA